MRRLPSEPTRSSCLAAAALFAAAALMCGPVALHAQSSTQGAPAIPDGGVYPPPNQPLPAGVAPTQTPGAAPGNGATPENHMTPLPNAPAPMPPAQLGPDAEHLHKVGPPPPPPADPRRALPTLRGAITLEQAITLARNSNPNLLSARQNLEATRAQEIQARTRQNPNLAIVGSDVTLPGVGAANPDQYSIQGSRLFERGQKRRWRIDIAKATTQQTADQLRDQERATELQVKQAFTNMLLAKASLTLANANLDDFRREVAINEDRYKAGDLGKLDFERLDLQLSQFESDQANALIALRQASDQLQTLIGVETPRTDFDIEGTIVPPEIQLDLQALDAKALASRPDYQATIAGVAVADSNVKLAYANGTADPTLEGGYDVSQTYNTADFSINIPIRIFDRNQGNKKTSEFAAQSARFTVVAAKNQVLSDVDQAWIGYTESKLLSDRFTTHYIDEAGDVLKIAQFAYEHGGIALIDYLDALRDARSTAANALQAYADTWLAIHQLSYAAATEIVP